jgi:hypothetical protein
MADTLQAVLGASTLQILTDPPADWGMVTRESEESENIYGDCDSQLRTSTSKLRRVRFCCKLEAATKDALIAAEHAVRMELSKGTNTLVVTPGGASKSVTFDVVRSPVLGYTFDQLYDAGNEGYYAIELVTKPWTRGPAETLWAASGQTSPALVSLGTLVGEGDPLLNVTVTRDWGAPADGLGMQYVAAAICNGASIDNYLFECEAGDMSGAWDADATVLNPHGGSAAKLPSATSTDWEYLTGFCDPSMLPVGRYRVLVRAKTSSSSADNHIAMRRIEDTDRDPKTRRELDTFWQWHDLGDWVNYGGNTPRLYGKSLTGSLWADCVLFLPVDWGYVWYTDDAENTHSVTFGWLPREMTYTNTSGAEGSAAARVGAGHGLKVPLSGFSLLFLVEPKGSDPTPDFTLDATYDPRWEMWRP